MSGISQFWTLRPDQQRFVAAWARLFEEECNEDEHIPADPSVRFTCCIACGMELEMLPFSVRTTERTTR